MKNSWRVLIPIALVLFVSRGTGNLWGAQSAVAPSVLHITQSQTVDVGSQQGFPTFLGVYKVLDGVKSPAEALALEGTLSLNNATPTFSEVLWSLVYFQGKCPADTDLSLAGGTIIWQEISKNPSQSNSSFNVNLSFPHPLPMTGCVALYYGGGPLLHGKATYTADLALTYRPASSNRNTVVGVGGEYCFGQEVGCENATAVNGEVFAVPVSMPAGHLLELFGNISDSTFDGTKDYGPLPTESWGSENDFYLLPGGCGIFSENIDSQGFPNPLPLSTVQSWLPEDALHLASVPQVERIPAGGKGRVALQNQVENFFSVPIKVNQGDCMLVVYGKTGNGATDDETQVHALMAP